MASSQSSDPTLGNVGLLLTKDSGISVDVAQLPKEISTSLDRQSEGSDEGRD